ncbi:MAG: NCS2 family permease, partial [Actinobacteria bacterium]
IFQSPDLGMLFNFSLNLKGVAIGTAIALVVSVMLSDFFDTMGTVVGIAGEAGLLDRDGKLPGIQRVLLVDSLAAAAGGVASASSNTTYIESAAGVSEGGRTGLTSVVVAILFFGTLFLGSLAGTMPTEATAPVLLIVGYFMMVLVRDINWASPEIGIPALLIILVQPLTFSITNGVGAGFIAYRLHGHPDPQRERAPRPGLHRQRRRQERLERAEDSGVEAPPADGGRVGRLRLVLLEGAPALASGNPRSTKGAPAGAPFVYCLRQRCRHSGWSEKSWAATSMTGRWTGSATRGSCCRPFPSWRTPPRSRSRSRSGCGRSIPT